MRIANRYRLDAELGRGGMGVVYRAYDHLTGDTLALKQVTTNPLLLQFASRAHSENLRLALLREFRTLAALRHLHIISVLDYGLDERDQPFYTMPLLHEGRPLYEVASALPMPARLELLRQILEALAYLHRHGILHRDLKPTNILVTPLARAAGYQARVLDFGLAVAAGQVSRAAGTPYYMAPEVIREAPAGPPADLFALGIIAYELLTGRHPFAGDTPSTDPISQILHTEPDLEALTTALQTGAAALPSSPSLDASTLIEHTQPPGQARVVDSTGDMPTLVEIKRKPGTPSRHPAERLAAAPPTAQALVEIVRRLLVKDPARRYAAAELVLHDLQSAASTLPQREDQLVRESYLQAARFVGREAELDQLDAALQQAIQGMGSAFLVGGESGVGKSRLLDELRIRALVGGALVLRGQGVAEGGLPYQFWREPLRRLILATPPDDSEAAILKTIIPDIETLLERPLPDMVPLEGRAGQTQVVNAIANLFTRLPGPTVLLLEDLHWAAESLVILQRLVTMVADLPLLIIASYRDDERPHLPDDLPAMTVISLPRFDEQGIAELSTAILGAAGQREEVVEFLQRETAGNAFFVVETVRLLAEEAGRLDLVGSQTLPTHVMTRGMQAVIERRLNCVPAWGRTLLQLAAVAGRQVDLAVLRLLAGAVEGEGGVNLDTWLQACNDAAVLQVQEGQWRFAHDKLREWLLDHLSPTDRPTRHAQIARAIETVYTDNADFAVMLAQHWQAAGNPERELHHTLIATERVFDDRLYQETLRLAQRALALLDDGAEALAHRVQMLKLAGDAWFWLGDMAQAVTCFEQALALAQPAGLAEHLPNLYRGLGKAADHQGNLEEAQRHLEAGLAAAIRLNQRKVQSDILNNLALLYMTRGRYDEAHRYIEDSLARAREVGHQESIMIAVGNLGNVAYYRDDLETARTYWQEALQLALALHDQQSAATYRSNLGAIAGLQGRYDEARAHWEECLGIYRQFGYRDGVAVILGNLGILANIMKDYTTARRYGVEALALAREINNPNHIASCLQQLGITATKTGAYDDAAAYFAEAWQLEEKLGDRRGQADLLLAMADLGLHRRDFESATTHTREALRRAEVLDSMVLRLRAALAIARLWHTQGESGPAVALAGLVASHAETPPEEQQAARELLATLRESLPEADWQAAEARPVDLSAVLAAFLTPP